MDSNQPNSKSIVVSTAVSQVVRCLVEQERSTRWENGPFVPMFALHGSVPSELWVRSIPVAVCFKEPKPALFHVRCLETGVCVQSGEGVRICLVRFHGCPYGTVLCLYGAGLLGVWLTCLIYCDVFASLCFLLIYSETHTHTHTYSRPSEPQSPSTAVENEIPEGGLWKNKSEPEHLNMPNTYGIYPYTQNMFSYKEKIFEINKLFCSARMH